MLRSTGVITIALVEASWFLQPNSTLSSQQMSLNLIVTDPFNRHWETDLKSEVDIYSGKNHFRHGHRIKATTIKTNMTFDVNGRAHCKQVYMIMPMGVMAWEKFWVTSYKFGALIWPTWTPIVLTPCASLDRPSPPLNWTKMIWRLLMDARSTHAWTHKGHHFLSLIVVLDCSDIFEALKKHEKHEFWRSKIAKDSEREKEFSNITTCNSKQCFATLALSILVTN